MTWEKYLVWKPERGNYLMAQTLGRIDIGKGYG